VAVNHLKGAARESPLLVFVCKIREIRGFNSIPLRGLKIMKLSAWFYAALVLFILPFSALAQFESTTKLDAGNGGRNTLQGDIITPNGQRLGNPVIVRLWTPKGEITTTSNSNGAFVFRQLTGGRYTVTVDAGDSFTLATEVVDIIDSGSGGAMTRTGDTYTVQVHLRPKASSVVSSGVVSANDPPKEALDLYNKALESVKEGNRDKAIEQLKGAVAIHPTFVAALNGLGVQYLRLGKNQDASDAFSKALKITPDSFILHLNSGIALFNLNKHAEAEAQFAAALLKTETSGVAHLYRARALIRLNRLDDAAKELIRAVEIGGDDVKLAHRYLAGIYVEKGEAAYAVRELELYLKASPDTKEADQIRNLIKDLNKKIGKS
jgi:tetratricopeptide (TPR) repeat protein